MRKLEEEWEEYIRITTENKNVEYSRLDKMPVRRSKAGHTGCCYSEGKIIGIPNSSRDVLEIDSENTSYKVYGKTRIGTFKWTGGCEYNGVIYGFPRKENCLLVVDPQEEKVREIPLNLHYRGEHHYGGTCTPDGIVYQPPRNTDHILRIDLNDYSVRKIIIPGNQNSYRYSSSILHPNGNIYMIPEYGHRMMAINPVSEEIEFFGDISDYLVFGVVAGIDGNIYGFSKEGYGLLKVSPINKTSKHICKEIGNPDCYGSVVGINGKIYGVPARSNDIFEYDVIKQKVKAIYHIDESGYAKCAGSAVVENGTIVMMPCYGDQLYLLKNEKRNKQKCKFTNYFLNSNY